MNTSEFLKKTVDAVAGPSAIDALILIDPIQDSFKDVVTGTLVVASGSSSAAEILQGPFFAGCLVQEGQTPWGEPLFRVEFPSGESLQLIFRLWSAWKLRLVQAVDRQESSTGWTTVFWHQLLTGTVLFDRQGQVKQLKSHYSIPYPQKLSHSILAKNVPFVLGPKALGLTNFIQALRKNDWIAATLHLAALWASLFDILFAVNHALHPGGQDLFAASCQLETLPPHWNSLMDEVKSSALGSPALLTAVARLFDAVENWLAEKPVQQDEPFPMEASSSPPAKQAQPPSAESLVVYTDGGCIGNPGKGAWAYVVHDGSRQTEATGGELMTTNNKMELQAVISALSAISRNALWQGRPVKVVTDSQYVRNGITAWIKTWSSNGWKTASKEPVKNQELWKELQRWDKEVSPQWTWVKGHAGNQGNERCDALVRMTMDLLE